MENSLQRSQEDNLGEEVKRDMIQERIIRNLQEEVIALSRILGDTIYIKVEKEKSGVYSDNGEVNVRRNKTRR